MNYLNHEKIILASGSPRRKELMTTARLKFDVIPADIDENAVPFEGDPCQWAKTLSVQKAQTIAADCPDAWIIGADTIVVLDHQILGKPNDKQDAIGMLTRLSGRTHTVITALAILHRASGIELVQAVDTQVSFNPLSEKQIRWYADTGEPYDKAGAYGIQGIGAFLVQKINGSYSNVVGLPVCELINSLMQLKVIEF